MDIPRKRGLIGYGYESDEQFMEVVGSKIDGLKATLKKVDEQLSLHTKYVMDDTDYLSEMIRLGLIQEYNRNKILKLDWNNPKSRIYQKIHTKALVKDFQLINYDEKDIKASIRIDLEKDNYLALNLDEKTIEYLQNDNWLIRITAHFQGEYLGYYINVDKQGKRLGDWSEAAYRNQHNVFIINSKNTIIAQKSNY